MIDRILERNLIKDGDKILCGVSGGADSMALVNTLLEIRKKIDFDIFICHINHNLRGVESKNDENFVRDFCKEKGLELLVKSVTISGSEQSGREARYKCFDEATQHFGTNKIATGHHADDVLETFIINMVRGTGLRGLCSVPETRDNIIRPLLRIKRVEIEDYLESINQTYVTDHTNLENNYTRNKIRNLVVPILKELNGNLDITALTDKLKQDNDYLEKTAYKYIDETDIKALVELDTAILSRIIVFKLKSFKISNISSHIVDEIIDMLYSDNPSAKLNISKHLTAYRVYDKLIISDDIKSSLLFDNNSLVKPMDILKTFDNIDFSKIDEETIYIRSRKEKDSICINKKAGTKTLKKIMIEKKIPKELREDINIVFDKDGIIAVENIGVDINRQQ